MALVIPEKWTCEVCGVVADGQLILDEGLVRMNGPGGRDAFIASERASWRQGMAEQHFFDGCKP